MLDSQAGSKFPSPSYKRMQEESVCIKGESNPRRVDGNDPGYHYPINACVIGIRISLYSLRLTDQINQCAQAVGAPQVSHR